MIKKKGNMYLFLDIIFSLIILSCAVYTECFVLPVFKLSLIIIMTKNIVCKINAVIYAASFSLLVVRLSHLAFIKSL